MPNDPAGPSDFMAASHEASMQRLAAFMRTVHAQYDDMLRQNQGIDEAFRDGRLRQFVKEMNGGDPDDRDQLEGETGGEQLPDEAGS